MLAVFWLDRTEAGLSGYTFPLHDGPERKPLYASAPNHGFDWR